MTEKKKKIDLKARLGQPRYRGDATPLLVPPEDDPVYPFGPPEKSPSVNIVVGNPKGVRYTRPPLDEAIEKLVDARESLARWRRVAIVSIFAACIFAGLALTLLLRG